MDQNPTSPTGRALAPDSGGLAERVRRDAPLALLDLVVALAAYLLTLVLRFDGSVPPGYWWNFWAFMPFAIAGHLVMNQRCGLYGPMWRYSSVLEARRIVRAGVLGGAGVALANLLVQVASGGFRALPLSVCIFGAVLNLLGTGAIRFQSRLFAARQRSLVADRHRVLVVGAGSAGSMMLKDLLHSPSLGLFPVGVVDDDRRRSAAAARIPVLAPWPRSPGCRPLPVSAVRWPSRRHRRPVGTWPGCASGPTSPSRSAPCRYRGRQVTARDLPTCASDLLGRKQVETDLSRSGHAAGPPVL